MGIWNVSRHLQKRCSRQMSTRPKLLYGSEQLRLESVVSRMLTSLYLCPVPIPNISEVVGLLKWILSAPVLLPPLCTSLDHTYIYEDGGHLWICFEFHMRSWKQNSIIQLQVAAIALQSGPHVLRHQPPKSNEKQRGSNAMAVRNTVTVSMYDFDWSCLNWFLWFPPPHFFCTFHSRSTHPWQLWTQVPRCSQMFPNVPRFPTLGLNESCGLGWLGTSIFSTEVASICTQSHGWVFAKTKKHEKSKYSKSIWDLTPFREFVLQSPTSPEGTWSSKKGLQSFFSVQHFVP